MKLVQAVLTGHLQDVLRDIEGISEDKKTEIVNKVYARLTGEEKAPQLKIREELGKINVERQED